MKGKTEERKKRQKCNNRRIGEEGDKEEGIGVETEGV